MDAIFQLLQTMAYLPMVEWFSRKKLNTKKGLSEAFSIKKNFLELYIAYKIIDSKMLKI